MKNSMDFTPPEHYRELDRQAKYYRRERIVFNILLGVAWISAVLTALTLIFIR